MYLVIFPEGTRYNPELKDVITDSQKFAEREGGGRIQQPLTAAVQTACTLFHCKQLTSGKQLS